MRRPGILAAAAALAVTFGGCGGQGVAPNGGGAPVIGVSLDTLREPAEAIVRECLGRLTGLTQLLLETASIESPGGVAGRPIVLIDAGRVGG